MFDVSVNLVSVVIAAVLYMVLGFLWYGPIFGKPWMKMMGNTKEQMKSMDQKDMAKIYLTSFIAALIMGYVLALFIGVVGAEGVNSGMMVGFVAWVGFVGTTMLSSVLYGKKQLNLYLIDSGYYLVALLIAGGVIAGI